ncbi:tRNA adenosine(34) deaminase TadA [Desulfogranum mediterraneum]|uniref:tRNA adenosine(34) deaminase TadA n=1 Tax=Desulfogranum mediterraneum TaxID=160661 RepID=UPI0009FF680D|nr:tRNA adenosine(34) deaminase TadA [Desulfogranum mediterraneum]
MECTSKQAQADFSVRGRPDSGEDDHRLMGIALECARGSAAIDEVPVGAVLVDEGGTILAACGNNCIRANDPAGHAEIRALRSAAEQVANYRLPGTTIYVTLEPCAMCAAAMIHARVARVVYGAADPKTGAITSRYQLGSDGLLNHSFSVTSGVRQEECSRLLKDFFKQRR